MMGERGKGEGDRREKGKGGGEGREEGEERFSLFAFSLLDGVLGGSVSELSFTWLADVKGEVVFHCRFEIAVLRTRTRTRMDRPGDCGLAIGRVPLVRKTIYLLFRRWVRLASAVVQCPFID